MYERFIRVLINEQLPDDANKELQYIYKWKEENLVGLDRLKKFCRDKIEDLDKTFDNQN
jgi:hypothetical protein